jgi:glycosyltransferase involved in cell wall biosynthesis
LSNISFSIIVPTYNEEADIRGTLDALVALTRQAKEIIVVDDSSDRTPEIVREYADKGVMLIRPEVRRGRCEARNIGVRASTGDVLLILNADVRLPSNFLEAIAPLYSKGYDSVAVMNTIANQEKVYARLLEARRHWRIARNIYRNWAKAYNGVFWTEAFSVRREVALKTHLFPSGYAVPLEAGEDARFAEDLRRVGCRGYFAEDIIVPHIAPDTMREFWKIRKGRGAGTPQIRYFLDNWPLWKISAWCFAKALFRLVRAMLVVPLLYKGHQLASDLPGAKPFDSIFFAWALAVEEAANTVGEYESYRKIRNAIKNKL